MEKHSKKYFASIDGLRFFAAVNVALFHYVTTMGGLGLMNGSPGWFFTIVKGPMFHASLFFILGGFIFATKIMPRIDSFSTRSFLKRRLFQLYPLHVVTTLLMVILIVTGDNPPPRGEIISSILIHLSFLFPFMPDSFNNLNTPSWALAAFFFAYLFMKPMLLMVRKVTTPVKLIAAMALCIILLGGWSGLFIWMGKGEYRLLFHMFPVARLAEFLLGMFLAQLFIVLDVTPGMKGWKFWQKGLVDLLVLSVTVLLFFVVKIQLRSDMFYRFFSYHTVLPLLFTLLVALLAIQQGVIARIMAFPFIRWLGRGSFYPYLLHIPVAVLAYRLFLHFTGSRCFFIYPLSILGLIVVLYLLGAVINTVMSRWRRSTVEGKSGKEVQ